MFKELLTTMLFINMLVFVIHKYLVIKMISVVKWNKFLLTTSFTCAVKQIGSHPKNRNNHPAPTFPVEISIPVKYDAFDSRWR